MHAGKAEINVTPLIDVLLVLLIIFMVITPLVPRGLSADLLTQSLRGLPNEPAVVLEVAAGGQLSINKQPVLPSMLTGAIKNLYSSQVNRVLFLSADKSLEYRKVAELIDQVKSVSAEIQVALMP